MYDGYFRGWVRRRFCTLACIRSSVICLCRSSRLWVGICESFDKVWEDGGCEGRLERELEREEETEGDMEPGAEKSRGCWAIARPGLDSRQKMA
jgi:hypothetical protein